MKRLQLFLMQLFFGARTSQGEPVGKGRISHTVFFVGADDQEMGYNEWQYYLRKLIS